MSYWTRIQDDPPDGLHADGAAGGVVFVVFVAVIGLVVFAFGGARGWW